MVVHWSGIINFINPKFDITDLRHLDPMNMCSGPPLYPLKSRNTYQVKCQLNQLCAALIYVVENQEL